MCKWKNEPNQNPPCAQARTRAARKAINDSANKKGVGGDLPFSADAQQIHAIPA
jgi:hypothetical protein